MPPELNADRSSKEEPPELQLVERAKAFDENALSELYSIYYPKIYSYALINLRNVQAAEDVASDVLLSVLESIESYRFRGIAFSAWVFRIARNRLIDVQRRRNRRRETDLPESLVGCNGETPHSMAELALDRSEILRALRCLTAEQRQVMVLRFLEGFDNASVSGIIGRSQSAVKSLQHRALNSMRKSMVAERRPLNYTFEPGPQRA